MLLTLQKKAHVGLIYLFIKNEDVKSNDLLLDDIEEGDMICVFQVNLNHLNYDTLRIRDHEGELTFKKCDMFESKNKLVQNLSK